MVPGGKIKPTKAVKAIEPNLRSKPREIQIAANISASNAFCQCGTYCYNFYPWVRIKIRILLVTKFSARNSSNF